MQAETPPLRVALLDLNNGHPNQGMRCLREILQLCSGRFGGVPITWDEFDVRQKAEVPDLSYDVYLSSGGPGSPFDGEGSVWEARYFHLLDALMAHNARPHANPKRLFLICHSMQVAARHFGVAEVTKRRSESFGIFPVYLTGAGRCDPSLRGLQDPFYGADFRDWQIVQPDRQKLAALGADVLALEKIRPHVALERAVMAIRFTPHIVGTQFHPEADPDGMLLHFRQAERKAAIVRKHGVEKYERIIHRIAHPDFLARTHGAVLPNFLRDSIDARSDEQRLKAA